MDSPISSTPSKSVRTDTSLDSDDESFQFFRPRCKIVSIEGNIGSGKTTLLTNMKKSLEGVDGVIFLKEPVDDWETIRDQDGKTMLQKFYADQDRYSFSFQMMAYISRLSLLRNTIRENPTATIITERSLYTDKMVFAKMLHESGKIEDVNYQIYLKWFHAFNEECPVHQIVYVKTDPTVCHERIFKRSRTGEDGIPLDYLLECHKYHEAMLDTSSADCVCDDQLVLNGNVDIFESDVALQDMISSVREFIGGPVSACPSANTSQKMKTNLRFPEEVRL